MVRGDEEIHGEHTERSTGFVNSKWMTAEGINFASTKVESMASKTRLGGAVTVQKRKQMIPTAGSAGGRSNKQVTATRACTLATHEEMCPSACMELHEKLSVSVRGSGDSP